MSDKKNKGGRPTKYDPKYIQEMVDFFEYDIPYREVEKKDFGIQMVPKQLPTFERFAKSIGVCDWTIWNWANEKDEKGSLIRPEFSNAYARARTAQKSFIMEAAMAGAINPGFASLLMKNVHGWKDKAEEESGKEGGNTEKADELIDRLMGVVEGFAETVKDRKDKYPD